MERGCGHRFSLPLPSAFLIETERRKIVIYGENIGFSEAQIQQIGAIVASALSKHLDSFNADVAGMPKGDNDMPKKIRRPILVDGIQCWVCGNTEQEYAENVAKLFRLTDTTSAPKGINPNTHNFKAYAEKYMDLYKHDQIRHTTLAGYMSYLRQHIYPWFGNMAVEEISIDEVQRFLNSKSHLAEHSVDQLRITLAFILAAAVEDGIISKNPAKSSRLKNPSKGKKEQRKAFSVQEIREIIADIPKLEYLRDRRIVALAAFMPLRREEILGIQIRDINVELKTVTIRRAITFAVNAHIDPITGKKISAGAAVVGLPKTKAGYRTIPITDSLWDLLAITENELAYPDTYLVCRPDDPYSPYTSQTFKCAWDRIKKTIDMHEKTLHCFRHTFATFGRRAGIDTKTMQSIGGWDDQKTLCNRYDHTQIEDLNNARQRMELMYTVN